MRRIILVGLLAWGHAASALAQPAASASLVPLAPLVESGRVPAGWRLETLPGQTLPRTRYEAVQLDGRAVLRVEAAGSYGHLVHPLVPPRPAAGVLVWRWRLDRPNAQADLRRRAGDDVALKVCVAFDLPLAQVPFVERQVLRLARARSGHGAALPAATVCYVHDPALPAGTVLDNIHSRRLRMIVVRGAGDPLGVWQEERREPAADFLRLFGDEAAGVVPAVTAVAVSGDADNTGASSLGHVEALAWPVAAP